MVPADPPCNLPAWPAMIALGGVPLHQGAVVQTPDAKAPLVVPVGSRLVTPDGLAEIARYVKATASYYDANELCRKAVRP